jgi:hypothetical protein
MHKVGDYTVNNYDLIVIILSSYTDIEFTKQIFMNISNTKFYRRAYINFGDKTNTITDGQNRLLHPAFILSDFYRDCIKMQKVTLEMLQLSLLAKQN